MTTDELIKVLTDYAIVTQEGRHDLLFDAAEALTRLAELDRMEATPKWDHFTCAGVPELSCDDLQSLAEDWIGLERDDPPQHIYRDHRGPDAWLAWADGKWTAFDTEEEALNARNK